MSRTCRNLFLVANVVPMEGCSKYCGLTNFTLIRNNQPKHWHQRKVSKLGQITTELNENWYTMAVLLVLLLESYNTKNKNCLKNEPVKRLGQETFEALFPPLYQLYQDF